MRRFLPVGLVALLIGAAPVAAPQMPKAGTYELSTGGSPGIEMVYWLIKITPKDDGAIDAEVMATNPRVPATDVTGAKVIGDVLHIDLKGGGAKLIFEGRVPRAGADKLLGS